MVYVVNILILYGMPIWANDESRGMDRFSVTQWTRRQYCSTSYQHARLSLLSGNDTEAVMTHCMPCLMVRYHYLLKKVLDFLNKIVIKETMFECVCSQICCFFFGQFFGKHTIVHADDDAIAAALPAAAVFWTHCPPVTGTAC
jgi:hypothetical protein